VAIRNRNRRLLRRSGCNMPRGRGSLPSATGQHWTRSFQRTSANCGCSTLQYPTVPYSTLQYPTVPYSTLQYPTVLYSTLQYPTVPYSTLQYSTVPYSTLQYPTVPYSALGAPRRTAVRRRCRPSQVERGNCELKPVSVQMWAGVSPSPGTDDVAGRADVAGVSPSPVEDVATVTAGSFGAAGNVVQCTEQSDAARAPQCD
jgi:hypothetical protein